MFPPPPGCAGLRGYAWGVQREELDRMCERDPSAKALVFSQFTSMLHLIAFRLHPGQPRTPGGAPVTVSLCHCHCAAVTASPSGSRKSHDHWVAGGLCFQGIS